MQLLIVESPHKARVIGRILGRGYTVRASLGHVRDLPPEELGVELHDGFTPRWKLIPGKQRALLALRRLVPRAEMVYFATDPDREGEAIAWHLREILRPERYGRLEFRAITPREINQALEHPRDLDPRLIEAQLGRRIADRLCGYLISPVLSEALGRRGLSAGRVQSAALRLVVEREREIESFVPTPYWVVRLTFEKDGVAFTAQSREVPQGDPLFERIEEVRRALRRAEYRVISVEHGQSAQAPPPPFVTSSLQQEANRRLRLSPERTMAIAQRLYEGHERLGGLITYMRTDSPRIAPEALRMAERFIKERFGEEFHVRRQWRPRSAAQDAHECIRPTFLDRYEEVRQALDPEEFQVYDLIWRRFVASQMAEARYRTCEVQISEPFPGLGPLRAHSSTLVFEGWRAVWGEQEPAAGLPPLEEGEVLGLKRARVERRQTQPPRRYTEGGLVRELERLGIGRPSTYAYVIRVLKARRYVRPRGGVLHPTELGRRVCEWLEEHYPWLVDYGLTAQMERELDEVEEGRRRWQEVVEEFYRKLQENCSASSSGS